MDRTIKPWDQTPKHGVNPPKNDGIICILAMAAFGMQFKLDPLHRRKAASSQELTLGKCHWLAHAQPVTASERDWSSGGELAGNGFVHANESPCRVFAMRPVVKLVEMIESIAIGRPLIVKQMPIKFRRPSERDVFDADKDKDKAAIGLGLTHPPPPDLRCRLYIRRRREGRRRHSGRPLCHRLFRSHSLVAILSVSGMIPIAQASVGRPERRGGRDHPSALLAATAPR